jgi:hypothetical protein
MSMAGKDTEDYKGCRGSAICGHSRRKEVQECRSSTICEHVELERGARNAEAVLCEHGSWKGRCKEC